MLLNLLNYGMVKCIRQDLIGLAKNTELEYSYTMEPWVSSKNKGSYYEMMYKFDVGCSSKSYSNNDHILKKVVVKWMMKKGTHFVKDGKGYALDEDVEVSLFNNSFELDSDLELFTRPRSETTSYHKMVSSLGKNLDYSSTSSIKEAQIIKFNFKGKKTFGYADNNFVVNAAVLEDYSFTQYDKYYGGYFTKEIKFKFLNKTHTDTIIGYSLPMIIDTMDGIKNASYDNGMVVREHNIPLVKEGLVCLVKKFKNIKVKELSAMDETLTAVNTKLTDTVDKENKRETNKKQSRVDTKKKNESIAADTTLSKSHMSRSTKIVVIVSVAIVVAYVAFGISMFVYYIHTPKDLKQRLAAAQNTT